MDIQVVLEVSAIATIIGVGISYFTFRKNSKLTYITQERKEWRAGIRTDRKMKTEEEYKRLREQLIYFLSLLLKDDWERSKNEVNGESGQILAWGLFALMFAFLEIGF